MMTPSSDAFHFDHTLKTFELEGDFTLAEQMVSN